MEHERQPLLGTGARRALIAVLLLGTSIAAVVVVLRASRSLADEQAKPGETCIYLVLGRELCGERARDFCADTARTRSAADRETRETCARVLREVPAG